MSVKSPHKDNKVPATLSPAEEKILHSLYTSHYETLLKSAQRFLRDPMASHDLVIDLLIHVSKRPDLALKARDLPYLVTAIGNRSINYLRKYKKEKMKFLQIPDHDYPASASAPDSDLALKELKIQIRQAMQTVSPKTRRIFFLHRRFKMTYHEIARHKNICVTTVETHISLALRCLRDAAIR